VNASLLAFASVGFVLWYVDLALYNARGPWPSYASEVRDRYVAFGNMRKLRFATWATGGMGSS
jgi:hypothetical protein